MYCIPIEGTLEEDLTSHAYISMIADISYDVYGWRGKA
jgi:hypothetical protein